MKRLSIDLLLAATIALVPRLTGAGRMEAGRMLILAGVYAAIAVLGAFRVASPRAYRAGQFGFAGALLLLGWLQSFPAWNHSGEIGLYILFGSIILARACFRMPDGQPTTV